MSSFPLIVMMSGKPWDGVRGADRQQAEQLTRYADVLWVDPPISPLTPARYRPGLGRGIRPRLGSPAPGITRLTPVALPGLSRPGIRATTWPLVRAQIRWALRHSLLARTGRKPHAVVSFSFDDVLGKWGEDVRTVLYGTDDWVAGGELMGLDPDWLRGEERRALADADIVVGVTPALVSRWEGLGATPEFLPNGVHADAYAAVESAEVPSDAVGLPGPVAGLIGRITARIDIGILDTLVDNGVSLLMVGPRDPAWEPERWAALVARPHVRHVEEVPFPRLPGYFKAIDVGITPYHDTEFNRASFPLKTLEYLAAGRPAVSTDLPATRWLCEDAETNAPGPPIVTTAGSHQEFADAVLAAARSPRTDDEVGRRQAFARLHSWRRRGDAFAEAIGLAVHNGGSMAGTARSGVEGESR